MNVTKQELLSALLDDEAGDFERRRLLDELKQDDALAAVWQRYALAGEVLRNNHTTIKKRDFLAGIHAAIDDEVAAPAPIATSAPVVAEVPPPKAKPVWHVVMQYGAAAGLGAVVMAAGLMLNRADTSTTTIAANPPALIEPVAFNATATPTSSAKAARPISRLDPKTQALLKSYIKDHIRYASTTSVVPTVRAVSYNQ